MASASGRFNTDSSTVPVNPLGSSPWRISGSTASAFRALAEQSCHILKGCQERATKARARGSREALMDLASWAEDQAPGVHVPIETIGSQCFRLLRTQEGPQRGATRDNTDIPCVPVEDDGGSCDSIRESALDSVESAFTDDMFKAGCFLFTKFYKERTKEIRLAFVCGYRDALEHVLRRLSTGSDTSSQRKVRVSDIIRLCEAPTGPTPSKPKRTREEALRPTDGSSVAYTHTKVSSPIAASASSNTRSPSPETMKSEDPFAHWYPGKKREFVPDEADSDDESFVGMFNQLKRTRFS
eukprot:m.335343 g.335343  ORF g.335343 m.335343 type:complete len:298 (-) comp17573_c0_seq1:118-1011(-)